MVYEGEQLDKDTLIRGEDFFQWGRCNNTLKLQLEEGSSARTIKG